MCKKTHILTIVCPDKTGIAARVFNVIAAQGGFITEAAQFGDELSRLFFMRIVFTSQTQDDFVTLFEEAFLPVATEFDMTWKLYDGDKPARLLLAVSKESHCLNDLLYR